MRALLASLPSIASLLVVACGDPAPTECADLCRAPNVCRDGLCVDPEDQDAGSRVDAAGRDAGPETPDADPVDAGTPTADARPDTGAPDAGSDAGPRCDDSIFPPGLRHVARDYTELGGGEFGETTHAARRVDFGEGRFVTFAFRTPDEPFRRRLDFVDPPTSHNFPDRENLVTLTLSECPGDFRVEAPCRMEFWRGTLHISTRAEDEADGFRCVLRPGQAYFMNFVSTSAPYERAPTCADREPYDPRNCSMFFSETAAR